MAKGLQLPTNLHKYNFPIRTYMYVCMRLDLKIFRSLTEAIGYNNAINCG